MEFPILLRIITIIRITINKLLKKVYKNVKKRPKSVKIFSEEMKLKMTIVLKRILPLFVLNIILI
jgi:hypothetical protein